MLIWKKKVMDKESYKPAALLFFILGLFFMLLASFSLAGGDYGILGVAVAPGFAFLLQAKILIDEHKINEKYKKKNKF